MRCKKHAGDLTSTVGVCSTCLRERLLLIIAAQSHPQLARQHSASDDYRKSDSHPPPLLFPRSVSPYVARRKSDDASHHHLRFYSTPQVGPSSTAAAAFSASRTFRTKQGRFSLLSNLFRSRSGKLNPDPAAAAVPSRNSSDASSSSPSWFSNMFSPQRKKHSAHCSTEYSGRRPRRRMDRGMSPARDANCEEDFENSPSGTGSSPEWWKRTPVSAGSVRRGKGGHMSGLAFCLSPLVRASPSRQWNQKKGGLPPDLGYSGEVRVAVKPHLSTAASFCANRSRKLCDLGRVNHNR